MNKDTKQQINNRVVAGMMLLDELAPGWKDKVDVSILDMSDPECCILGQVYGDFRTGVRVLGLDLDDGIILNGFDEKYHLPNLEEYLTRLTEEWVEYLT